MRCRVGGAPGKLLQALLACRLLVVGSKDASWVDKLDHGSFRGFPSLKEGSALLESWLTEYPDLLRRKSIGESYERRPIHAYVLAGPPPAAERALQGEPSGKPQVLITALMHSREPATLTVVLYAMGHLLELYQQGDPEAVYALEGRELWAVPFVNPDGYAFNEKLGLRGMVRKNRRPTCPGREQSGGVDINRNFEVAWKKNAFSKCHEEYGGETPFSEPETQALKTLSDTHKFKAAVNFHSFGSMLTHPWNYAPSKDKAKLPVPDDDVIYQELQQVFKFDLFGAAINTVGYTALGESDDWFYSAKGIIAMSPEVGPESGGFYPNRNLIRGIDSLNFKRTMHMLLKAGLELKVEWSLPPGSASGEMQLRLNNSGLSASMGGALRLAVNGPAVAAAPGVTAAAYDGTSIAVRPPSAPASAVVLEVPPLARRSSSTYTLRFGAGASAAGLELCAVEVGASRACHCHGGGAAPPDRPADTARALPGGGDYGALCAAASAAADQAAAPAVGAPVDYGKGASEQTPPPPSRVGGSSSSARVDAAGAGAGAAATGESHPALRPDRGIGTGSVQLDVVLGVVVVCLALVICAVVGSSGARSSNKVDEEDERAPAMSSDGARQEVDLEGSCVHGGPAADTLGRQDS